MASGQGFDLKQFLDEQRQEGQVESAGAFTVAADKALKKLANFSLPREYDWVLKVVQAVNLWQAERLVVRQTRSATSFFFLPGGGRADYPTDAGIVQALTTSTLDNQDPTQVLCMALRSLVEQIGLSFVLAVRQDGVLGEPIFAGDDTSQLSARARKSWTAMSQDGVRLTVSHFRDSESFTGRYVPSFSKLERRDIAIAQHLEWDAFASSVPIYLDGRRITDPPQQSRIGYLAGWYRPLLTATLEPTDGPDRARFNVIPMPFLTPASRLHSPTVALPKEHPWFLVRTLEWRKLHRFYDEERQRAELHSITDKGPHKIFLVRHGVIVSEIKVPNSTLATNVYLFVSADHYRSDLIGLSVDTTEKEVQSHQTLKRHLVRALVEFRESFTELCLEADCMTANQQTDSFAEEDRLEAGFSIFTESLASPFRRISSGIGTGFENLDHLFRTQNLKERYFGRWTDLVLDDLDSAIKDLSAQKLVRPSRS